MVERAVTDKVRFSYVHAFAPFAFNAGDPEKYSTQLLIPKEDKKTLSRIKAAVNKIKADPEAVKRWGGKVPSGIMSFLNDGDAIADTRPECAGCYYVNAKNTLQPGIVDASCQEIIDPAELYSGCYGRASLTLFPYNKNGSKGIGVWLNNLQKLDEGEPLSSVQPNAADDFATFSGGTEEDDPLDL
jgi:hypothetical protein